MRAWPTITRKVRKTMGLFSTRRSSGEANSHDLVACLPQASLSEELPKLGLEVIVKGIAEAINIDLTSFAGGLPLREDQDWFTLWPGEHYTFLVGLCKVIKPELSLDTGTYHGGSALA